MKTPANILVCRHRWPEDHMADCMNNPLTWNGGSLYVAANFCPCWPHAQSQLPYFWSPYPISIAPFYPPSLPHMWLLYEQRRHYLPESSSIRQKESVMFFRFEYSISKKWINLLSLDTCTKIFTQHLAVRSRDNWNIANPEKMPESGDRQESGTFFRFSILHFRLLRTGMQSVLFTARHC